jgi:hypothetical protein
MDCLKDDTKAANVIVELQIEPYSLVEAERDYLSVCKRYSKLYVVPEFSKVCSHLHHASKFSHPQCSCES